MGATWSVESLPDGSVRLDLRGDVDLVAEAPLVEQVDALAGSGRTGAILLDLTAVDFIDSSGVRALLRMQRAHGDRVRLVAVSRPVRRVLDIAGLASGLGLDDATAVESDEGTNDTRGDGGTEPDPAEGSAEGRAAG